MARCHTMRIAALTIAVLLSATPVKASPNPLTGTGTGTGNYSIDFSEYPFPQSSGIQVIQNDGSSQSIHYNLFDDNTGTLLTADNDDLADLSIVFTTSAGGVNATSNRPRLIWRDAAGDSKQITGELSYTDSPTANNPGTRQFIEVEIRFAPHLNITAVDLDTSSFNTSGTAWEFSQVSYLDSQYQPFSIASPVPRYLDAPSDGLTGNQGLGHFYWAHTRTVTGVGSNQTSTGSNGPNDTSFVLASTAAGLTGQRIGGVVWRTTLEDTRGVDNPSSPSFTASLRGLTLTGTISTPAPAIQLSKAAGTPSSDTVGGTILYGFTVENTGNTQLEAVSLNDPTLGGAISCPRSTLLAGQAMSCTATSYTLTQADIDANQVINTATVTAQAPTGATVTDTASVTTALDPDERIAVSKTATAPDTGVIGELVTFVYTITNTGVANLTNPTILDPLLAGPLSCGGITLTVGATTTCQATYALTQADIDAGQLTSVAKATALDATNTLITDVVTLTLTLPPPPAPPPAPSNTTPPKPVPMLSPIGLILLLLGVGVLVRRRLKINPASA